MLELKTQSCRSLSYLQLSHTPPPHLHLYLASITDLPCWVIDWRCPPVLAAVMPMVVARSPSFIVIPNTESNVGCGYIAKHSSPVIWRQIRSWFLEGGWNALIAQRCAAAAKISHVRDPVQLLQCMEMLDPIVVDLRITPSVKVDHLWPAAHMHLMLPSTAAAGWSALRSEPIIPHRRYAAAYAPFNDSEEAMHKLCFTATIRDWLVQRGAATVVEMCVDIRTQDFHKNITRLLTAEIPGAAIAWMASRRIPMQEAIWSENLDALCAYYELAQYIWHKREEESVVPVTASAVAARVRYALLAYDPPVVHMTMLQHIRRSAARAYDHAALTGKAVSHKLSSDDHIALLTSFQEVDAGRARTIIRTGMGAHTSGQPRANPSGLALAHAQFHKCDPYNCTIAHKLAVLAADCPFPWANAEPPRYDCIDPHLVKQYPLSEEVQSMLDAKIMASVQDGTLQEVTEEFITVVHPVGLAHRQTLQPYVMEAMSQPSSRPADTATQLVAEAFTRAGLCNSSTSKTVMSALDTVILRHKFRQIYDMRGANAHMNVPHMHMHGLETAAAALRPGVWMLVADVSSGFTHIVMSLESRKYLGIRWREKLYAYSHLPFGSAAGPYLFCILSATLTDVLRARGVDVVVTFIDDILVFADSKEDCLRARDVLLATGQELGILFNPDKLVGPTQELTFLGVRLCGVRAAMWLPAEKVARIHIWLSAAIWLAEHNVPVPMSLFSALRGRLSNAAIIAPVIKAILSPLWLVQTKEKEHYAGMTTAYNVTSNPSIDLTRQGLERVLPALKELQSRAYFEQVRLVSATTICPLQIGMGPDSHGPSTSPVIAMDASASPEAGVIAFGGTFQDKAIYGQFKKQPTSSAHAEAVALAAMLIQWASEIQNSVVKVITDCRVLYQCLKKGGASDSSGSSTDVIIDDVSTAEQTQAADTASTSANSKVPTKQLRHKAYINAIMRWCHTYQIYIDVRHIPRELNTTADAITKAQTWEAAAAAVGPSITLLPAPRFQIDELTREFKDIHVCSNMCDLACRSSFNLQHFLLW